MTAVRKALVTAAGIVALIGAGIWFYNPFGLWSWVGEQVGPSCSLYAPQDSSLTLVVRGWRANSNCDAVGSAGYGLVASSNTDVGSAQPLCSITNQDVKMSVYDSAGDMPGQIICSAIEANTGNTNGVFRPPTPTP
jgi:hypothetical protein